VGQLDSSLRLEVITVQVVLDRQAAQPVKEISSEIWIAGDIFELVQEEDHVEGFAIDSIKYIRENKLSISFD